MLGRQGGGSQSRQFVIIPRFTEDGVSPEVTLSWRHDGALNSEPKYCTLP